MPPEIRRIVTGHNAQGKAIVLYDGIVPTASARPGAQRGSLWSSVGFPLNNDGAEDEALREVGTTIDGGTVFRFVSFEPGNAPRMHRTDSTDYAIVMSGEIDMVLDDDVTVHVKAGDVIVQRGTIHNWLNHGTEPCVIAFILIAAKPVEVGGQVLHAQG